MIPTRIAMLTVAAAGLLAATPSLAQSGAASPGWKEGHAAQEAKHRVDIAARDKDRLGDAATAQRKKELALERERNVNARNAVRREHYGNIEAQNRAKRKNGGKLPEGYTPPHG